MEYMYVREKESFMMIPNSLRKSSISRANMPGQPNQKRELMVPTSYGCAADQSLFPQFSDGRSRVRPSSSCSISHLTEQACFGLENRQEWWMVTHTVAMAQSRKWTA